MASPSPQPNDPEFDPQLPEDVFDLLGENAAPDSDPVSGDAIPFKFESVGEMDPAMLAQLAESFDRKRRLQVIEKDGRFPIEAYNFLQRGVRHTVELIHGEDALVLAEGEDPSSRHVNGRQLAVGLRDLALGQWGLLAGTVLRRWGVRSTRDFGEMVFVLVDGGVLSRTDSDRVEDFDDVYPFGDLEAEYRVDVDSVDLHANAPGIENAGCCT